jgi:uncharacterized protein (DUF58 family)
MNKQWYYISLAIIVVSFLLRQPLLLVIGLLGLLVVSMADIWIKYCLRDLRYTRQFSEQRVLFGEEITLSLSIENAKLLPLPWLEVEDSIPQTLTFTGQRVRISLSTQRAVLENLFSLHWYERITRRYTMRCNARGVHTFGPTMLRSGDVFGFQNREEKLANRQYLLVYPLVVPLTRFGLPARYPFGDYQAPRRLLEDPSRVIGVRDYMYGDDLRRVHWKASARAMQLQSKVYQPTTTYTLVLFLNVMAQLDAWFGFHPELTELAICATASVADWALDHGYAVGLYANTVMYMPELATSLSTSDAHALSITQTTPFTAGQEEATREQRVDSVVAEQLKRRRIHLPPASNEEQRKRIMEALARVQSYFGNSIEDVIRAERTRLPVGATVVVVTSTVSEPLLDTLERVRQSGHAVTLLFIGDGPPPRRLAGVSVHHLGGENTWKELVSSYSRTTEDSAPVDADSARQPSPAGFRL